MFKLVKLTRACTTGSRILGVKPWTAPRVGRCRSLHASTSLHQNPPTQSSSNAPIPTQADTSDADPNSSQSNSSNNQSNNSQNESKYRSRRLPTLDPTLLLIGFMPLFTFALGTWQVQRLKWKVNLIDESRAMLEREAVRVRRGGDLASVPEYQRVELEGTWDNTHSILIGPRVRDGTKGFNLITPLILSPPPSSNSTASSSAPASKSPSSSASSSWSYLLSSLSSLWPFTNPSTDTQTPLPLPLSLQKETILVDRGFVSAEFGDIERWRRVVPEEAGEVVTVRGTLRHCGMAPPPPSPFSSPAAPSSSTSSSSEQSPSPPPPPSRWSSSTSKQATGSARRNAFTPDNKPEKDEWYWMDVEAIGKLAGREDSVVLSSFFVEEIFDDHSGVAQMRVGKGIPVGRAPTVDLRNQHLNYAITWYALSALTGVMFINVLNRRARAPARKMPRK